MSTVFACFGIRTPLAQAARGQLRRIWLRFPRSFRCSYSSQSRTKENKTEARKSPSFGSITGATYQRPAVGFRSHKPKGDCPSGFAECRRKRQTHPPGSFESLSNAIGIDRHRYERQPPRQKSTNRLTSNFLIAPSAVRFPQTAAKSAVVVRRQL